MKTTTKRIVVLAGNYHQAVRYAREKGWRPRDWKYIASLECARGFRGAELHKIGTWHERTDAQEILCIFENRNQQGTP